MTTVNPKKSHFVEILSKQERKNLEKISHQKTQDGIHKKSEPKERRKKYEKETESTV